MAMEKAKFRVSILSRIDSNVNRFKFYQQSSFVIPFFRVKCLSYLKELAYTLNLVFRFVNCLIELMLEINVMSEGLISGFVFCRSSIKCFLIGVSFLCFLHPFLNKIIFWDQLQDVDLVFQFSSFFKFSKFSGVDQFRIVKSSHRRCSIKKVF